MSFGGLFCILFKLCLVLMVFGVGVVFSFWWVWVCLIRLLALVGVAVCFVFCWRAVFGVRCCGAFCRVWGLSVGLCWCWLVAAG